VPVVATFASGGDVAAAVRAARDRFGGLDVVLANAAVSVYEEFEHQSEETIDLVSDTDLKGALFCAQLAIPELKRRGGGSIVFVSSVQAYITLPAASPSGREGRARRRCAGARPRGGPLRHPGECDRAGDESTRRCSTAT